MYALCLESSHERGMGHLFRGINFYRFLERKGEHVIILINRNAKAINILQQERMLFEIVDFEDIESNWESALIQKYDIDIWLNDKFQTSRELYAHVKENQQTILVAIDEEGNSADLLDIHFVGMVFQNDFVPKGKNVFRGIDYIILNDEIRTYRHLRVKLNRVIVSMGGSDTYGVTLKILEILQKNKIKADIVVGPSFRHSQELLELVSDEYHIFQNVPSLIQKFSEYDLAITGGGVTCLEAAASGLPCLIVANEVLEIDTAKYVENLGAAVYAGYHMQIDEKKFDVAELNIERMSRSGIQKLTLDGAQNIYKKIQEYTQKGKSASE